MRVIIFPFATMLRVTRCLLVMRAKLLLGIIIHHIYLSQIKFLIFENIAARLADNAIQIADIRDVLSDQGPRARLSDPVRRILLHPSGAFVAYEGA